MTSAPAPFLWPPRPLTEPATHAEPPLSPGRVPAQSVDEPRGIERAWIAIERAWLAPVREPLRRRIRESGWAPDELLAFCDRCAHTIGPHERHEFGCGACAARRMRWTRIVRVGSFENELREWVLEAKFHASHATALALGGQLGRRLRAAGADGLRGASVVPVPVDPVRRFLRGIDHTAWIAKGVGRELGIPVRRLLRARRGPSQRTVAPSAREANVRGRFVRRGGASRTAGPLIVIDDVLTTGATMQAAVRALGRAPKEIWCGVVAVTPEPGEPHGRAGGTGSPSLGMDVGECG